MHASRGRHGTELALAFKCERKDRLHRHLHVAGRSVQRAEHDGGSDRQADGDGEYECAIGFHGVLSSHLDAGLGAG